MTMFDVGADGKPQAVIPGAERIGVGQLVQRKMDAPLRASKTQRDPGGLFGEAHLQADLLDLQPEPTGEWIGQRCAFLRRNMAWTHPRLPNIIVRKVGHPTAIRPYYVERFGEMSNLGTFRLLEEAQRAAMEAYA
jgi:hypothetical protein